MVQRKPHRCTNDGYASGCDLAGVFYVKIPEECGDLELRTQTLPNSMTKYLEMDSKIKLNAHIHYGFHLMKEKQLYSSNILHRVLTNQKKIE